MNSHKTNCLCNPIILNTNNIKINNHMLMDEKKTNIIDIGAATKEFLGSSLWKYAHLQQSVHMFNSSSHVATVSENYLLCIHVILLIYRSHYLLISFIHLITSSLQAVTDSCWHFGRSFAPLQRKKMTMFKEVSLLL